MENSHLDHPYTAFNKKNVQSVQETPHLFSAQQIKIYNNDSLPNCFSIINTAHTHRTVSELFTFCFIKFENGKLEISY